MAETELKKRLRRMIAASGPISVSDYMALCLGDHDHGYYIKQEPFGAKGDFITAPEVSQMFGELIGIWCVGMWHELGRPVDLILCEIGPGRGTLMSDLLRTIAKLAPEMIAGLRVAMVETSARLTNIQREKLSEYGSKIAWYEQFSQLPSGPLLLVANELFDAIPTRQYVKSQGRFLERMVSLTQNGELTFAIGSGGIEEALLPSNHSTAEEGSIFEAAPARTAMMQEISERIASGRGAALIIDYGHLEAGFADTLQALLNHKFDDVFAHPGEADLTSHVDFHALQLVAEMIGCNTATTTQGEFLLSMGLLDRAGRLGAGKDAAFQENIRQDVERLAAPDQMGTLFKVLAISDKNTKLIAFDNV